MYKNSPNNLEVSKLLKMIPAKLLEDLAEEYQVDWNVSRLRGEVMLDLLLLGLCRADRASTRVLEYLYNSPFFESLGNKYPGHKSRHSSIAERLTNVPSEYFQAIFEWAVTYFSKKYAGGKLMDKVNRFDSTLISVSSALVNWGMKVGREPKNHPAKVQFKITVGMKGVFPTSAKVYFEQEALSEEKVLYDALVSNSAKKNEWSVIDQGMKGRKKFQKSDLQDISFVTRGGKNLRYQHIKDHRDCGDLEDESLEFIQDSEVYLYSGNEILKHKFRLVEARVKQSGEILYFITNIWDLDTSMIAQIYRLRWDIEVFFRFIKQELNIKHLLSHSKNGVKVQVYVMLLLAILLTVFKKSNQISSYKIAKMKFADDLFLHLGFILFKEEYRKQKTKLRYLALLPFSKFRTVLIKNREFGFCRFYS